jgi:hypothetical protein
MGDSSFCGRGPGEEIFCHMFCHGVRAHNGCSVSYSVTLFSYVFAMLPLSFLFVLLDCLGHDTVLFAFNTFSTAVESMEVQECVRGQISLPLLLQYPLLLFPIWRDGGRARHVMCTYIGWQVAFSLFQFEMMIVPSIFQVGNFMIGLHSNCCDSDHECDKPYKAQTV